MSKFGKSVIMTDIWARGVLKSIDWIKRKGTTRNVKPSSRRKICISDVYLKSCLWRWYANGVDHQSWLTFHLENTSSTLKLLATFQSKESITNAQLQPHLQCLQLGFLTIATNLHRERQNMPSKLSFSAWF